MSQPLTLRKIKSSRRVIGFQTLESSTTIVDQFGVISKFITKSIYLCLNCNEFTTQDKEIIEYHIDNCTFNTYRTRCKKCNTMYKNYHPCNVFIDHCYALPPKSKCIYCDKEYVRSKDMKRHVKTIHKIHNVQLKNVGKKYANYQNDKYNLQKSVKFA